MPVIIIGSCIAIPVRIRSIIPVAISPVITEIVIPAIVRTVICSVIGAAMIIAAAKKQNKWQGHEKKSLFHQSLLIPIKASNRPSGCMNIRALFLIRPVSLSGFLKNPCRNSFLEIWICLKNNTASPISAIFCQALQGIVLSLTRRPTISSIPFGARHFVPLSPIIR